MGDQLCVVQLCVCEGQGLGSQTSAYSLRLATDCLPCQESILVGDKYQSLT